MAGIFCSSGEKVTKGGEASIKILDVVEAFGFLHVDYGIHLVWICLYPLVGDHEIQKFARCHPEKIFEWVQLHVVAPQHPNDSFKS